MRAFRRRGSREDFLKELQNALGEAMHRKDSPDESFITYASLEAIWTDARLKTLADHGQPGFGQEMVEFVKSNLLRTISILVYIGWDHWGSFGKLFLHHQDHRGELDRLDDRITRYTPQTLDFLDPAEARLFLSDRWAFIPVVLKQGEHHQLEKGWRLPFVNPPTSIGSGAYGQVSEEVIACGHFMVDSEPRQVSSLSGL